MALVELVNQAWFCVYYFLFRPVLKWTLRQWTGQCELLRITYNVSDGYRRTHAIESCLGLSKIPAVRCLALDSHLRVVERVRLLMEIKDIKPEIHSSFEWRFRTCVEQISGYKELLETVEDERKTPYSDQNPEHEEKLMQLWKKLEPGSTLSARVSKDWQRVGFQGDDPKTDFRGMGILGLDNLLYFLNNHPDEALEVYSHSHHPKFGYSFAVVGINLTALVHDLLARRLFRQHLYNSVHGKPRLQHFHSIYCHIFHEFDRFYRSEEPADIMQFNVIKKKYLTSLVERMKDPDFQFISKFTEAE